MKIVLHLYSKKVHRRTLIEQLLKLFLYLFLNFRALNKIKTKKFSHQLSVSLHSSNSQDERKDTNGNLPCRTIFAQVPCLTISPWLLKKHTKVHYEGKNHGIFHLHNGFKSILKGQFLFSRFLTI